MKRWKRIAGTTLAIIGALIAGLLLTGYFVLRSSLPQLDGQQSVQVAGQATIARDALGSAIITAETRADAYFAQGFVHAQERFFEMDLTRRSAAGELAELFGAIALPRDRSHRVHRMRARLTALYPNLPAEQRTLLERYSQGVNAGLQALSAKPWVSGKPWAYTLLRCTPKAWQPVDTLLVNAAMAFNLQDDTNSTELIADSASRVLSPAAFHYLFNRTSSAWDAPLMPGANADEFPDPPMPNAAELDFRSIPDAQFLPAASRGSEAVRGSNNWAVAGGLTKTGSAMLANDMHLGLGVPSIWFRQQLNYKLDGVAFKITGVSLPGAPGTVVGSNGKVAWGNTNSYGDWLDFVRLQAGSAGSETYLDGAGVQPISSVEEIIRVKGGADEHLLVRNTRYGPIVAKDSAGNELALAWVAHRPGGVDANAIDLEISQSAAELLERVRRAGIPHNNIVAADQAGHIGWTIGGQIPVRAPLLGLTGSEQGAFASNPEGAKNLPIPSTRLSGDIWLGFMTNLAMTAPTVMDPPNMRLYTANSRVVNKAAEAFVGNGGYALGARASRIRDLLNARKTYFRESDMLALQLDDQAPLLEPWWQRLFTQVQNQPRYGGVAKLLGSWNRRAAPESIGYRIVRNFRAEVLAEYLNAFAAPMRKADPLFTLNFPSHLEVIVAPILRAQAPHLLPKPYTSYAQFELACLDRALAKMLGKLSAKQAALVDAEISLDAFEGHTWGEQNTAKIQHPLAKAIPALGWFLDMPGDELPGDTGHVVRAQGPAFGASQRLSVSPGHEENGLLHMPGGQSGHPLSPFYGAGHSAWVNGEPTPLLPGASTHVLTLVPAVPK